MMSSFHILFREISFCFGNLSLFTSSYTLRNPRAESCPVTNDAFNPAIELLRSMIDHRKVLILALNGPAVGGGAAWFPGIAADGWAV